MTMIELTEEQLAEAVAQIFEADANRTPGEWSYEPQDFSPERVWAGTRLICHVVGDSAETQETAAFIATAPLMVRIIRQLWEERDGLRKTLNKRIVRFDEATGTLTLVQCENCEANRVVMAQAKPVEVGDTELAALVVEAFNKAEKPENHIGLCAGYRIAQAILSRYKAMVAWYARDHYNAGWQAATAAADAKYLPVIKEVKNLRGLLWYAWWEMNAIRARNGAPEHVCRDYWDRLVNAFKMALGDDCKPWPSKEAKQVLAKPLLEKKEEV